MSELLQASELDLEWDNIPTGEGEENVSMSEEKGSEVNTESEEQSREENSSDEDKPAEKSGEETGATVDEKSEEAGEPESKALNISELDDSAVVKVKVDGELQEISLKEYKNGISGEKAIAKRFSEFDKKEKDFKKQLSDINEYIADLGSTMKKSSVLEGVYKVGELTGLAPHQIKQALIKELLPEVHRLETITEEEAKLEYQKEDLEYKQKKMESDAQKAKAQQAQVDLQERISQARETHNIDDLEWTDAFKYLDTHLDKLQDITVDMVAEKVLFDRAVNSTEKYLEDFDGGKYLGNEQVFGTLHKIVMDNPDFTDEDIKEILEQGYGIAQKNNTEKQLSETVNTKQTKPQEEEPNEIKPLEDWD